MQPSIAITPYRSEFKEAVRDLILPIQQQEFGVAISYEDQPDVMDIPAFYQKNNGEFWLALHDGELVGSIGMIDVGERIGVIRKMFVRKDKRGKTFGIGQTLLDTLLSHAAEHGMKDVYLGTVGQMVAAHRFYERNGFSRIEEAALPECMLCIKMKVDHVYYHKSLVSHYARTAA